MNTLVQSCKSKKYCDESKILNILVDKYIHEFGNCYEIEDQWWGDKDLNWEQAIERAWKSRFANGKMHGHQCRVAHNSANGLEKTLVNKLQPKELNDFQTLYDWIKSVVGCINGLGRTTAYDVARRLGAWLGLKPSCVYLHAGAAMGAKKLGIRGEVVPLSVFPKEIQSLGTMHAENFLCIYKHQIPDNITVGED
ncbi:hypothetical protein [Dactylococcopsis salina]|uniref:Uncharacterized protein n=1 Tax=Dactylococcopsis salina (strain PCC 8305) TaxID=13035 RepID=K9YZB0_DACS8|nr:hypothetical protein [Dactylococcopsis salina]AFZ51463.1 hypothetical protein Dacsa_2910 [Dactylococcopsis salina PCC 8305]